MSAPLPTARTVVGVGNAGSGQGGLGVGVGGETALLEQQEGVTTRERRDGVCIVKIGMV